jgi:hypothetical protein
MVQADGVSVKFLGMFSEVEDERSGDKSVIDENIPKKPVPENDKRLRQLQ